MSVIGFLNQKLLIGITILAYNQEGLREKVQLYGDLAFPLGRFLRIVCKKMSLHLFKKEVIL